MTYYGVYARYSSDRQSPASIQDQLRKCKEFADRQGWVILEEHVYIDQELSGAGADRPAYTKLLNAAFRQPRPFDILLVDDTSRLSRNLPNTMNLMERLKFFGIRVVA